MPPADFAYRPANDSVALPSAVSIFADLPEARREMREDVAAAGLELRECSAVAALLEGQPRALGEIVLIDCPQVDAGVLAALARLDMRAARSGAQVLISTGVDALDEVFACCDQSAPQILVDPNRAERIIALGRALAGVPGPRLRELGQDDRVSLLRLSEQVGHIAHRLERLGRPPGISGDDRTFRVESPGLAYTGKVAKDGDGWLRRRPALPEPRFVRRIIRQRQMRARFFDAELFADPAWDILLDLTAARAEHARVSVTSLCIASGVPPTTALRWIRQMTDAGLLERVDDESDRRRAFIGLTDRAAEAMARYFAELGQQAAQVA